MRTVTEEPSLITRLGKITRLRLVSATRSARSSPSRATSSRADVVDLGLRRLAVERNPLGHRPAAEIDVVGGEMAVAELDREPVRRQHQARLLRRRLDLDAGIGHEIEPGRMRRRQVIVVDAVLDHQLPVGGDVVFLHAGDDLHLPGRRLVDDEIDVVLGAGEIVGERLRVRVEVHEPEAAILLEPRRPLAARRTTCRSSPHRRRRPARRTSAPSLP